MSDTVFDARRRHRIALTAAVAVGYSAEAVHSLDARYHTIPAIVRVRRARAALDTAIAERRERIALAILAGGMTGPLSVLYQITRDVEVMLDDNGVAE